MLSTRVVSDRSKGEVIRPSTSSAFKPAYCHATEITGMSILGKMSEGVRRIITGLAIRMSSAITMKV